VYENGERLRFKIDYEKGVIKNRNIFDSDEKESEKEV
jgi:hypothetical protein